MPRTTDRAIDENLSRLGIEQAQDLVEKNRIVAGFRLGGRGHEGEATGTDCACNCKIHPA
jgi:hypothetical protein